MGGERGDGSGDSKGGWVGHGPTRFLVDPLFGIPVFFLISHLSSFGWHIKQITFGQQYFNRYIRNL